MATYDSLPDADKAVVQATVNLIRGACGSVGRALNVLERIADDSNAISLITSIDAGEVIPNTTGFTGADDMTRAELEQIWLDFQAMRTNYDTPAHRAAWSKAVGVVNLLGTE